MVMAWKNLTHSGLLKLTALVLPICYGTDTTLYSIIQDTVAIFWHISLTDAILADKQSVSPIKLSSRS